MMELFQEYDVEFVSSTEKFDTSTPMGRAMLNICIVFAQLERETIQKRGHGRLLLPVPERFSHERTGPPMVISWSRQWLKVSAQKDGGRPRNFPICKAHV